MVFALATTDLQTQTWPVTVPVSCIGDMFCLELSETTVADCKYEEVVFVSYESTITDRHNHKARYPYMTERYLFTIHSGKYGRSGWQPRLWSAQRNPSRWYSKPG